MYSNLWDTTEAVFRGKIIALNAHRKKWERSRYNTIQYNTIQYNTIQYNTIQYNIVQYNTIQYYTIWYNTHPIIRIERVRGATSNKFKS